MRNILIATVMVLAGVSTTVAQAPAEDASDPVVATYDGDVIRESELEEYAQSELLPLRQQEYEIKRRAVDNLVFERLLERQAAAAGISRDEYYAQQVGAKVADPSEEEIESTLERFRARLPEDDAEARQRVIEALRQRSLQETEAQNRSQLLAEADLDVRLTAPRTEVPVSEDDPILGPADAPVTIVGFTDYQCPFCERAEATLDRVRETFGDQVRIVMKQLPLPNHPQARPAAMAALCAGEQGKYWEMHDRIFANRATLSAETFQQQAQQIEGLDVAEYTECVAEERYDDAIEADLALARQVGAQATPTFFVNGRVLRGAQPYEEFARIISEELAALQGRESQG